MDDKKNIIINNIISTFITLVLVIIILFVYNMFMAPKQLVITEVDYESINKSDYNVNGNELDGTLFDTLNFQFTDKDLDRYEDLKDYYKGRDNPFTKSESKDEITIPGTTKTTKEGSEKDVENTTNDSSNKKDDIDTIID